MMRRLRAGVENGSLQRVPSDEIRTQEQKNRFLPFLHLRIFLVSKQDETVNLGIWPGNLVN
jgi:hypothetical protein